MKIVIDRIKEYPTAFIIYLQHHPELQNHLIGTKFRNLAGSDYEIISLNFPRFRVKSKSFSSELMSVDEVFSHANHFLNINEKIFTDIDLLNDIIEEIINEEKNKEVNLEIKEKMEEFRIIKKNEMRDALQVRFESYLAKVIINAPNLEKLIRLHWNKLKYKEQEHKYSGVHLPNSKFQRENVCYDCKAELVSTKNIACKTCGWMACHVCGACSCCR